MYLGFDAIVVCVPVRVQVEGCFDNVDGRGEGEVEGEEKDEGAEVLLPDQKRSGCAGRWLQVEEIRAEGCQEQSPSQVYIYKQLRTLTYLPFYLLYMNSSRSLPISVRIE